MHDDDTIVATVICPRCKETVLLEVDPECPDTPPNGECCRLVFVVQPDGRTDSFDIGA